MAKKKPAPTYTPKPAEPIINDPPDPMEDFVAELEDLMADGDLSRNALHNALDTLIRDVWDAAHELGKNEGFEAGEEHMEDESRAGVLEALSVIMRDWETGRNLLERALGGKIFGLGTNNVEMF